MPQRPISFSSKMCGDVMRQWSDDDDAAEKLLEDQAARACSLLEEMEGPFSKIMEVDTPDSERRTGGFAIRRPTTPELGLLYNWLSADEASHPQGPNNPAKYWSRAGASGAIQSCFEEECGLRCKRRGFCCCLKLVCCYPVVNSTVPVEGFEGGLALPVGFATLKDDGFTIDAMGTFAAWRRHGIGKSLALHCIGLAKGRADVYEVDSLISAMLFWRALGFLPVKASEISKEKCKELEFHRPMRRHLFVEEEG